MARLVQLDIQRASGSGRRWMKSATPSSTRCRSARGCRPMHRTTSPSATEIDGPIDWSTFDVNTQASLTTTADQSFTSLVEATIPAPVTFPGAPAVRFWEMEDAHVAYGLVPVGPTDLAHLMLIEYASSYGNDWFVVPLTLPVGSVTRINSLIVTDTFGVRSLVRPIGDPALPPAYFSLWQSGQNPPLSSAAPKVVTNRFFLPPTLSRTIDSAPLEDVLFMRDEMANLAWAIERIVESPMSSRLNATKRPMLCRLLLLAIRRTQTCRDICCHRKCRLTGFHCCRYNCKIPCTGILPARSFRGLNAAPSCSPTARESPRSDRRSPAIPCEPSAL